MLGVGKIFENYRQVLTRELYKQSPNNLFQGHAYEWPLSQTLFLSHIQEDV